MRRAPLKHCVGLDKPQGSFVNASGFLLVDKGTDELGGPRITVIIQAEEVRL